MTDNNATTRHPVEWPIRNSAGSRPTLKISAITFFLAVVATAIQADEPRQHVVIVVGASGTAEFEQSFTSWADDWKAAAIAGVADCTLIGRDDDAHDRALLQQTITTAMTIETLEPLWLVMIGHGTFDGRAAQFNLRGKDVSAAELSEWLTAAKRPIVVVNSASCSAPFINALSGNNRVIVTATKDGNEVQFARFGGFLAKGIQDPDADIDRDGQTSLLEAWLFAARRTQEFYDSDGRLATEHSLLDDNGDGQGVRFEVFEGVRLRDNIENRDELDGKTAHRWHLIRSEAERSLTPEQRLARDELEQQLEALRQRRSEFAETDYLTELERILVPLAKIYENSRSSEERTSSAANNAETQLPEANTTPRANATASPKAPPK